MKRTLCAVMLAFLLCPVAANSVPLLYARGTDTSERLLAAHNA